MHATPFPPTPMPKNTSYEYDSSLSMRENSMSSFSTFPSSPSSWLDESHGLQTFPRNAFPERAAAATENDAVIGKVHRTPSDPVTAQLFVRQEEIDHRESQLNARMAQFETLVRNTKLSLQAKLEEVGNREKLLEESETNFHTQRLTQEERLRNERASLEGERIDIQSRKAEIEDRLARRERELQEISAEREREVSARAEDYRQQLEAKLLEFRGDFQKRYEKKCKEVEAEFLHRMNEEKVALDEMQRKHEEDFEKRISQLDREVDAKKEEFERRFTARYEELERQFSGRRQELEESVERRIKRIEDEYSQKKNELETRFERREEQIRRREVIIQQSEEEWTRRRESFEGQWNEFDLLRKGKTEELARRETKLDERDQFCTELEARLKRREIELAALDESLKGRESQAALDAQKFANLQQMETDVLEQQAEAGRIRESLVRERHQMQKTIEAERKRLRETQELALRRIEEERTDLVQQNKRMEQMRLAMDRSREELGRMHRETLEIRLATEELWLRLSGDSASEDLKESICRIRARLAEQYHDAVSRLEAQKTELKETREQMLQQHEKTLARREELEHWLAKNEDALSTRERLMKERELELDQRQAKMDDIVRRCRLERVEMEKEVRLLQDQIDRAFDKKRAA